MVLQDINGILPALIPVPASIHYQVPLTLKQVLYAILPILYMYGLTMAAEIIQ